MALRLYTFRGKYTGRFYYGAGNTTYEAAKELNIAYKHLILERSEVIPPPAEIEHARTSITK